MQFDDDIQTGIGHAFYNFTLLPADPAENFILLSLTPCLFIVKLFWLKFWDEQTLSTAKRYKLLCLLQGRNARKSAIFSEPGQICPGS